jgi:hypothetical protein
MENTLQIAGEYWPYILGVFFVAIIVVNFRTWFTGRRSES